MKIREAILQTAKTNSPHLKLDIEDVPTLESISRNGIASSVITTLEHARSRSILKRISKVNKGK